LASVALAKHLVRRMLTKNPTDRPSIDEVARHPFLTSSRHAMNALARGRGRARGMQGSRRRLLPTAEDVDNAITTLLTFRGIVKARNISKLLLRQARRRIAAKLKVVHVLTQGSPRYKDKAKAKVEDDDTGKVGDSGNNDTSKATSMSVG